MGVVEGEIKGSPDQGPRQPCRPVRGHRPRCGGQFDHVRSAVELAERTNGRAAQLHSRIRFAGVLSVVGDNRRAFEHASRALELCRILGTPVEEAHVLNHMG